jgi:hypothetical protein
MNTKCFTAIALFAMSSFIVSSCETPTGQAAGIGAAAGALTGAAIQADQAARYGPPPPGGFPFADWTGTPGLYYSPYTGRVYNLRGVLPGGLTRDVDTGQLFRKP